MIVCIIDCPNGVSVTEAGAIFYSRGESPFDAPSYEVIDKPLFMLSVLKYGIEFRELKCSV